MIVKLWSVFQCSEKELKNRFIFNNLLVIFINLDLNKKAKQLKIHKDPDNF